MNKMLTSESKNGYRDVVVNIVEILKPYCSNGNTRIIINNAQGYDDTAARLGFSDILWAAAPFIKGGCKNMNVEELYRRGTVNGTNPQSGEYWGRCGDFDPRFKEMAPIACGLLMNSGIISDMFSKSERQNIVNWLYNINYYKCGKNCEQFFVILVNSALRLLGRPYDVNKLEAAFRCIENMYIGSGWYGIDGKADYSATMAIQFYSLIYAGTMASYDINRCGEYVRRANLLVRELRNIKIKEDDLSLLSFYSACLYAGINIYDVKLVKMALNHCADMVIGKIDNYVKNENIDNYSIDTREFLASYMKTFLVLTLPEDHYFWDVNTKVC